MATAYRDSCRPLTVDNSSDEGELESSGSDGDGSTALWKRKRVKQTTNVPMSMNSNGMGRMCKPKRSKNANIWGSVLADQSSNDISSGMGAVGMDRHISRGPESFEIPATFKGEKREKDNMLEMDSSTSEEETEDRTADHAMQEDNIKTETSTAQLAPENKRKRKRKKIKTNNIPTYKPGQKVTLNKRCELSDTDAVDKVAEEIAFRLWERKRDLIRSLTEILGVPAAIDYFNKTEDIEKNGGLLTYKGARRRTPGGTFIHLIRNDPKLDQEPISAVFTLETERERMQWEKKRLERKTKKAERHENGTNTVKTIPNPDSNLENSKDVTEMSNNCEMDYNMSENGTNLKCENLNPQVGASDTKVCQIRTAQNRPDDEGLSDGEIVSDDEEG